MRQLVDVRSVDVAAFPPWRRAHVFRGKAVGVSASNRDLAALKALFAWAVNLELLPENPCERVPLAREFSNVERIVVVETADFELAIAKLPTLFADAAVALLGTGMRWGSLAGLALKDLERKGFRIKLARPKGKVGIDLVVSERTFNAARAVVGKLSKDVSGFDGAVQTACKAAEVQRWTAHHLRHTFACACLRAGADIRQVQHWLGHAKIETTERYLHFVQAKAPPAPV